jgi:hypothetical protein
MRNNVVHEGAARSLQMRDKLIPDSACYGEPTNA